MLYTEKTKINYDSKFDVLYYTWGDTSNSYGDEDDDGIVSVRDIESDEIRGYTIFNFKRICNERSDVFNYLAAQLNMNAVMNICGIK